MGYFEQKNLIFNETKELTKKQIFVNPFLFCDGLNAVFMGCVYMKYGKQYICTRWRLFTYLTERGFKPVKVIPDITRLDFKNWVFDNSDELESALSEYFAEKKRKYK